MFQTLLLIWSCFADTFVWHIWNLSGTVASLAPFPACFKFCACPTEPRWDPPLRAGTVQSDHTSPTECALGSVVLCEYAQRRCNPLSSICQCHCCKRETDVLHCRFTLDSPVFSLLSLPLAIHQPVSPYVLLQQFLLFSSGLPLSLPSFHTHTLPNFILCLLSVLPTSSALRSCSTGDSLLSSAFIRSAKSAPALAPPIPVLLHHHHPLLPPLADQLAGTHSLHYLPACLPASACRFNLWLYVCQRLKLDACYRLFCLSFCCYLPFLTCDRDDQCNSKIFSQSLAMVLSTLLDILHVTNGSWHIVRTLLPCRHTVIIDICPVPEHWCFNINSYIWILLNEGIKYRAVILTLFCKLHSLWYLMWIWIVLQVDGESLCVSFYYVHSCMKLDLPLNLHLLIICLPTCTPIHPVFNTFCLHLFSHSYQH